MLNSGFQAATQRQHSLQPRRHIQATRAGCSRSPGLAAVVVVEGAAGEVEGVFAGSLHWLRGGAWVVTVQLQKPCPLNARMLMPEHEKAILTPSAGIVLPMPRGTHDHDLN